MIKEILNKLQTWTEKNKVDTICITGETPFYLFTNRMSEIKNVKLVCINEKESSIMFKLIASECLEKKYTNNNKKLTLDYNGINIEMMQSHLCNYMKNEEVKNYLIKNNFNNHLDKCFIDQYISCNTLLYLPKTEEIKDVNNVEKDINNKVIRTCLPEDLIFKYSNKVFFVVLYYAVKYNFSLSPDIIQYFNSDEIKHRISKERFNDYINTLIQADRERTISLLKELKYLE